MKIALLGYGKMGKEIERLALERSHSVVLRMNRENSGTISGEELAKADIAIEFSAPLTAFENIKRCFDAGLNVVCGTTGWNDQLEEAKKICIEKDLAFFYASNFSIGVNIFFELNRKLAEMMEEFPEYQVSMEEMHHTQKLDAPSGTAITLVNDILKKISRKKNWKSVSEKNQVSEKEISIRSVREGNITGIHSVAYRSVFDVIEIRHEALSRQAFAQGALLAAEWVNEKKGIFGMEDLLISNRSHGK